MGKNRRKLKLTKNDAIEKMAAGLWRLSPDKINFIGSLAYKEGRTSSEMLNMMRMISGATVESFTEHRPWRLIGIEVLRNLEDHFIIQPRVK